MSNYMITHFILGGMASAGLFIYVLVTWWDDDYADSWPYGFIKRPYQLVLFLVAWAFAFELCILGLIVAWVLRDIPKAGTEKIDREYEPLGSRDFNIPAQPDPRPGEKMGNRVSSVRPRPLPLPDIPESARIRRRW